MGRLRFRAAADLVDHKTLQDWHVSGYAALYADLKKKAADEALVHMLNHWLYASTWRSASILLWILDEQNSQVVGTAQASMVDTPVPKIQVNEVIVSKSHRGQGHGERLVRELVDLASKRWPKADRVELTSNPTRKAARAMYLRIGFSRRDTDVFTFFFQGKATGG